MTLPSRVLLDTAVFVYAVGVPHPYTAPCRALVGAMGRGTLGGEASVEVVQEFLHQRARRTGDRASAVLAARDVAGLCTLHDVTVADLRRGLSMFAEHEGLHARDALHAATAVNRGIEVIISPDQAFDEVPGLQRIDPVDAAAMLGDG